MINRTRPRKPLLPDQRVGAWLCVLIVLFNVFGGSLIGLADSAPRIPLTLAEATEFCGEGDHQPSADHQSNEHGRPVCSMCFPLGSVCGGAAAPADALPILFPPLKGQRIALQAEELGRATAFSAPFHARAPPIPA